MVREPTGLNRMTSKDALQKVQMVTRLRHICPGSVYDVDIEQSRRGVLRQKNLSSPDEVELKKEFLVMRCRQ